MADCQAVVEIKNDLIRTMGECRDVTDQYQTGRSAYLRLGQLFMRLFADCYKNLMKRPFKKQLI